MREAGLFQHCRSSERTSELVMMLIIVVLCVICCSRTVALKFGHASDSSGGLAKHRLLAPIPGVSEEVGLGPENLNF